MQVRSPGETRPHTAVIVDEHAIHGHYLATANGDFDTRGPIHSRPEDLDDIAGRVARFARPDGRPVPVLLWAHGGLVGEEGAAGRVRDLLGPMTEAGIYPIHFLWHTGFLEEVRDVLIARSAGLPPVPGRAGALGWVGERLRSARDGLLEMAARPLGRPIWSEMKADARDACHGRGTIAAGPAFRLLDRLRSSGVPIEYHLAGHSAGSILHCHLLDWFVRNGVRVRTCSFLAPAVTTGLFLRTVRHAEAVLDAFYLHGLPDRDERDDHCGEIPGTDVPIYHKSLLYLVAYSFEEEPPARLLGLARNAEADRRGRAGDADPEVRRWLRARATCEWYRPRLERPGSTLHGSFDEDPRTIAALIERVRG
jgi:hypothetical protein